MKRVLIGIGTFENFKYIEEHCLRKVFDQTFQDFDILLVDNSEDISHSLELKNTFPNTEIHHIKRPNIWRDACKEMRQYITDYAVFNGYEFLFFLDIDMIIQEDTLEKLISHDVDFVTAPVGYMHQPFSTCFLQDFDALRMSRVPFLPPLKPISWAMMKYEPYFMEIVAVGLACALVKCSILTGIKFRVSHESMAFMEDILFCSDIRKKGVKLFLDKTMETIHAHCKNPERNFRRLN